jgi:hypothetical protein
MVLLPPPPGSPLSLLQVATLVVVPVQETQGYGIGFGIPTIAFGEAAVPPCRHWNLLHG